jgi:hypothetical protein
LRNVNTAMAPERLNGKSFDNRADASTYQLLGCRCLERIDLGLSCVPKMPSFDIIGFVSKAAWAKYAYYRIKVAQSSPTTPEIKYLAFVPLISDSSNEDLEQWHSYGKQIGLITVPEGDWNIGYLVPTNNKNNPTFELGSVEKRSLPSVAETWHFQDVDYATLQQISCPKGHVQAAHQMHSVVCHDLLGYKSVLINFEWSPDEVVGPALETSIYQILEGFNVAPRFLGHLRENQERVIGYAVELYVNARAAALQDLEACRTVLSKLHKRGILHNRLSKDAFLVIEEDECHEAGEERKVLMQGFSGSIQTTDEETLKKEMASLEEVLKE